MDSAASLRFIARQHLAGAPLDENPAAAAVSGAVGVRPAAGRYLQPATLAETSGGGGSSIDDPVAGSSPNG
jgi:hypothetical protein